MSGVSVTTMAGYEGELDQIVAVAFATSDLLVELDDKGTITFIAGAVDRIGANLVRSPVGLPLDDLFDPADRIAVREHALRVARGQQTEPLLVHLRRGTTQTMLFGGCRLPQQRTILFLGVAESDGQRPNAISLIAETERGLMSRPVFTALAMRRLPEDLAGGLRLSFIETVGFAELAVHIPSAMLGGFTTAVARQLRLSGPAVEAVGDLGRGRYGVLHRGAIDVGQVQEAVLTLVRAMAPRAPRPTIATATMEPGRDELLGRRAARVVRYAIERFAAGGEHAAALAVPQGDLDAIFADTVDRVAGLERIIEDGAFELAYQPVVDLKDRTVRHAEVLVRFGDGSTPIAAIAASEAAGMIGDFDLAICARALDNLAARVPDVATVAVNLSGRSLESRGFADRLCALLAARKADPSRLMFELTETVILGEVESVNKVVQEMRRRGFRFCLDDLGSGANSFHYLRSIPVDFVKIDGAFGRDALNNERDRSFLRYVSGFCKENRILAIAEMIETESQAEGYRQLGIDYGQGYLFGRPAIYSRNG